MNFETKLCRICLQSDLNDNFVNIFNPDSEISSQIYLVTSIKIVEQPYRDDLICPNCLAQLNIAIEFRSKCHEANAYFQQLHECLSTDPDISHEYSGTVKLEITRKSSSKSKRKKNARLKYKCPKCEKTFSCRYYLHTHDYAVHADISPENFFECDNCTYRSKTKSLMRSHQINSHSFASPKSPVTFQCKFCGRICMSTGALYCHERTHRNPLPQEFLKCQHCCKSFKERRLLKNHIQLVHEKSRMKQCSACGFIATCSGSLNKHIKAVHLKLRNHVCDECKKEFVTNQQLLRHKRTHSGERPFKCINEACPKFFADSHGRKRHLKICSFNGS